MTRSWTDIDSIKTKLEILINHPSTMEGERESAKQQLYNLIEKYFKPKPNTKKYSSILHAFEKSIKGDIKMAFLLQNIATGKEFFKVDMQEISKFFDSFSDAQNFLERNGYISNSQKMYY